MAKPKITYILKNTYAQTTASGTLSTAPSDLPVNDISKFNSSGGYAYIEVVGLRYEFYYAGISTSPSKLLGAKLLQTGAILNYNANDKVYPVFEIYPADYIDKVERFEQDRNLFKKIFSGDIIDDLKGYYFTAEIIYDKITFSEYAGYTQLFNKYVDEIYYFPDRLSFSRFRVVIAEPHEVEDFRDLAYKNFRIKFQSKRRYEHGFNIADKWRWGNRVVIFNDRETHSSGLSWYSVMTEQNSKDETTKNNLETLKTNFQNHISSLNPHSSRYYLKSEVDNKLKGRQVLVFVKTAGGYPNNGWLSDSSGASQNPHFIGISGQITKVFFKGSISGINTSWDLTANNYTIDENDKIAIYKTDSDDGGTPPSYTMAISFIKNNQFWFALDINYVGYYPNEDDIILSVLIENIV